LIAALMTRGLTVHVAAPGLKVGWTLRKTLESKGLIVHDIPLHRTGMNPLVDIGLLVHLWRLMSQIRPDIVMGYTIKPVIYGSLAARLARVPKCFALISGLGYAFTKKGKNSLLRSLVRQLYRFSLSNVQMVFFQNPDDEELFHHIGILRPHTKTLVLNGSGVDVAQFSLSPFPGKLSFLLIARLLVNKGVREYVNAARQVRRKHPDTLFRLVGWIDDNPDSITQSELDEWIAEGVIEYLGRQEDVRSAIKACSVYVLPSYREGTPRTVLEAMAMGRAIITTDAPGCRETVVDGENGFLVSVKSVEELATAMQRFIEEPSIVKLMGQRSRDLAVQKYDVHKVNETMLSAMGIE
jgi:glycosyltransferase involved in cell wall biosynthesis